MVTLDVVMVTLGVLDVSQANTAVFHLVGTRLIW